MRLSAPLLAVLALACGRSTVPVGLEPAPEVAFGAFMQAVADSNLTRMAQLWGTGGGSAAATGRPRDYQRRIGIMYSYLRGATGRVVSEVERTATQSTLLVEFLRAGCLRRVPVGMVRTGKGGWLVQALDLGQVGVPGAACPSEQRQPPR